MAVTRSRAYKLQFSADGIQLFLRVHVRLCRLVVDLLPHGTTLYVAVVGLGRCATEEIAACLLDPELERYGGRIIRYVGTSPALAGRVEDVIARVVASQQVYAAPQVWKIFLAALMALEERADRELLVLHDGVAEEIGRPRAQRQN
ncbi:hypothetical protein NDN01_18180 [Sphingomonas sp. QA11]|uniref:hypothetical protein n=1 Tax=Sphingomonas sp. QA11 TaxID=2950605 RepID=UPI0023493130|nr:hypothetical protein [Sphingomonas sp. QA11]WCM25939.1 hypothetical protein NDN01_18180 [Sphingomonas sp. QA11]